MIHERLKKQLQNVVTSYNDVNRLILFGSRAYGDYNERSDIDIAVDAPKISQKDWLELSFEMEESLDTLLELDIVRLQEASPALVREINNGYTIYEKADV